MIEYKNTNYFQQLSESRIGGRAILEKFGINTDIDIGTAQEDVRGGSGLYAGFPKTYETMEVLSSDVNDTILGTGARTIKIYGLLDSNFNEVSPISVNLNGITPVIISAAIFSRANRIKVMSTGSNGYNLGNIIIRYTTTTTNTFSFCPIGNNQSTTFAYTVPMGKNVYINKLNILASRSNGGAGSMLCKLMLSENGSPFRGILTPYITNQSSYKYEGSIRLKEKTDIVVRVMNVSDNNMQVSCDMLATIIDL